METAAKSSDRDIDVNYPGSWSQETMRRNWMEHLEAMAAESRSSLPLRRVQYQVEQNPVFQDAFVRWPRMKDTERFKAWKSLLECSENVLKEILPACVQCGECCRKGSPTLQLEDLEILRQGKIPWNQLFCLRKGEPVRSPFKNNLFFLLDERIKIREKAGTQECVFLNSESHQCTIYSDRPVQCRAQACWDATEAKQLSEQPYLTRRDIFKDVELILEIIGEHDRRCSFASLNEAFKRLEETKGGNIDEVLEMMAYEDHFRNFMGEKLKAPADVLDLVFGRSFADLAPLFGFQVRREPDGTRCLVFES